MSSNIMTHALRHGVNVTADKQPELHLIPIEHLHVDPSYQRMATEWKINELKKKWSELAAGVLDVSYRDGKYWVFDGQHRLRVMQALSIKNALCMVHYGLSIEDEAALFVEKNSRRATPKAADVFRGRLLAKDPQAVAIQEVVDSLGFEIRIKTGEKKPNSIDAVGSLWRIASRYGTEHLKTILFVLQRIWPDDPTSREGNMLLGMADFLWRYSDMIKLDDLVGKLSEIPMSQIRRMASGIVEDRITGKVFAYSRALWNLYNHKRKSSRLPLRY